VSRIYFAVFPRVVWTYELVYNRTFCEASESVCFYRRAPSERDLWRVSYEWITRHSLEVYAVSRLRLMSRLLQRQQAWSVALIRPIRY